MKIVNYYLRFWRTHLKTISFCSFSRTALWDQLRKVEFVLFCFNWTRVDLQILVLIPERLCNFIYIVFQIKINMFIRRKMPIVHTVYWNWFSCLFSFLFHLFSFFSPLNLFKLWSGFKPWRTTSLRAVTVVVVVFLVLCLLKPRTWVAF